MIGTYATAKVFTNNIEKQAENQIINMCNLGIFDKAQIRIMPDVHSGKGSVIGFTSRGHQGVIPNIVGVDLGCGMLTVELQNFNKAKLIEFDEAVREVVPSGFAVHPNVKLYEVAKDNGLFLEDLQCFEQLVSIERLKASLGTLGAGNHFIELNEGEDGKTYLVIHTGSRNLGKQVAEIYQNKAIAYKNEQKKDSRHAVIQKYKKQGREKEIEMALKTLTVPFDLVSEELLWLKKEDEVDYLRDSQICQLFASLNRKIIATNIIRATGLIANSYFETVHNYIDPIDGTIRKGAVSAKEGEKILIPLNMKDGSLICIGKGNKDWNESAPHGAGRIMSRKRAKEELDLESYKQTMSGIYSSSVCAETIDESPMAYKNYQEIVDNIQDTVEIVERIKPIYNFKATV